MDLSKSLALAALALLCCWPAGAQPSPECIDASPADVAVTYDAVQGFRLCAPTLDADGQPLELAELTSCTVQVAGVAALTQAATPGEHLVFPPITGPGPKRGNVSATCTGPGGTSDATPTYSALLRQGKPQKPIIVEWR